MALGKLANILRFKLKEIDPSTGEGRGRGRGGGRGDCVHPLAPHGPPRPKACTPTDSLPLPPSASVSPCPSSFTPFPHWPPLAPPFLPSLPLPGEAEEDGYEDEYQLEELDVLPADYVKVRDLWLDHTRSGRI